MGSIWVMLVVELIVHIISVTIIGVTIIGVTIIGVTIIGVTIISVTIISVTIIGVTNTLVTIQESINVESTNPKSCTCVWTQLGGDTSYEQKERKRRMFKNHFLFFRPFFPIMILFFH